MAGMKWDEMTAEGRELVRKTTEPSLHVEGPDVEPSRWSTLG